MKRIPNRGQQNVEVGEESSHQERSGQHLPGSSYGKAGRRQGDDTHQTYQCKNGINGPHRYTFLLTLTAFPEDSKSAPGRVLKRAVSQTRASRATARSTEQFSITQSLPLLIRSSSDGKASS